MPGLQEISDKESRISEKLRGFVMKKRIIVLIFLTSAAILSLINCGSRKLENLVSVSVLPQKYFVERIAGGRFSVNVMIPPGQSPHSYEPTARQMKKITESVIYFKIGYIAFESANMENIHAANRKMKIIDTADGIDLIKSSDSHEETGHDEHGIDPHTWLSPRSVKIMAKIICDALIEEDNANEHIYIKNYQLFIRDIDSLDELITGYLGAYRGKKIMVYHPSWAYFARDYGLVQIPLEKEGKEPGPMYMKEFSDIARKEKIKTIFTQKEFPTTSVTAIANDIGARIVLLDILDPDWPGSMKRSALAFRDALK